MTKPRKATGDTPIPDEPPVKRGPGRPRKAVANPTTNGTGERPRMPHEHPRILAEMPPDLLSIPQACKRLGISQNTGYTLVRSGEFPGAIRIGGRWRVSLPRLERYLHGED